MADPASLGRPRLKWALLASLGLNLVFVGLLAGAVFRGPPPPPMPGLWHYARALPEPYRRDLGRVLRDSRPDWSGPRQALRAQQEAMAAALTAEPFDPEAVGELLKQRTRVSEDLAARGAEMLVTQITRMSTAERAAYAESLRDAPHGPPSRRK